MPIITTDTRTPGQLAIASNGTIFEINPWEFGSFDPTLFAFAPLKYVGSKFDGGQLASNQPCVAGFDSASYLMGTSSTLFNQFFLQVANQTYVPKLLRDAITKVLAKIDAADDDIAPWNPNPFYNYRSTQTFAHQQGADLTLVDGGEDLQNIPFNPLIQPGRNVDVIFVVDSSADTEYGWPSGLSPRATYLRNFLPIQNGTQFPAIPDDNTFINLGFNKRPSWFGCEPSNYTSVRAPLIVYLPNAPYSYFSNVTTFDPSYTIVERDSIIQNGCNIATMGNDTVDPGWPACVGCAVILRQYQYNNLTIPDACQSCMSRYCWNGTLATTPATGANRYNPGLILNAQSNSSSSDAGNMGAKSGATNLLDYSRNYLVGLAVIIPLVFDIL